MDATLTRVHDFVLEAHGELLAGRLARLVEAGYRPLLTSELPWFDLVHPHRKAVQVQLWADGQIVDRFPRPDMPEDQRTIIAPEDEAKFVRFLASIPRPTAWQRFRAVPLGEALGLSALWLGLLGLGWLLSAAWGAMFSGP
jgi:hypothetical protein